MTEAEKLSQKLIPCRGEPEGLQCTEAAHDPDCPALHRPAVAQALALHDARIAALEAMLAVLTTARPEAEWHEDIGDVLWWKFPVDEPPYLGSPLCLGQTVELHGHAGLLSRADVGGWPGYHTHWTPIRTIVEAVARTALADKTVTG